MSFFVQLSLLNLDRTRGNDWGSLSQSADWREKARLLDYVRSLLNKLPEAEHDVIELYFFRNLTQEAIAQLLEITQQAVSHRMYRAFRRLMFLVDHPDIPPAQLRIDLQRLLAEPRVLDIFCSLATTSSCTETARQLGLTVAQVHALLRQGLRGMRMSGSVDALFYQAFFSSLLDHHNILREVVRRGPSQKPQCRERQRAARTQGARVAVSYA